jgi:hypothetical protein
MHKISTSESQGSNANIEAGKRKRLDEQKTKQTPWSEPASELYRPIDRRLSAN